MQDVDITATFGPVPGDRATLSKTNSRTMDAIYQHPLTHNLEWSDVVALFETLGTVDPKHDSEVTFGIAGGHYRVRKPHAKDLTSEDVMTFRHMLTKAGWAPRETKRPEREVPKLERSVAAADLSSDLLSFRSTHPDPTTPDLIIVVDYHHAKVSSIDIASADASQHMIKPYDPWHLLHHLSHKNEDREAGQRAAEDASFYERIAQAVRLGGRIVVVGHGNGHSNAAHHLAEYLRDHHPETYERVVRETAADLSSLTDPQILALGRRALQPSL